MFSAYPEGPADSLRAAHHGHVTSLNVMDSGVLTRSQRAEVQLAYQRFRMNVATALGTYVTRHEELSDGSRVRMVSNNNVDTVWVWPTGGGGSAQQAEIPHGFVVVTTWATPTIYKFDGTAWAADTTHQVPQIPKAPDTVTGYNQVLRTADSIVLPLVYDKDMKRLWDYAQHRGPAGSGDYQVPICLEYPVDGTLTFSPHKAHMALNATVTALDGTVLYTMAPPGALADESVQNLPGASDVKGTRAVLQAFRSAALSPGSAITRYRFKHEVIKRTAVSSYAVDSTDTVDFTVPISANTVAASSVTSSELGESIDADFGMTWYAPVGVADSAPWPPFTPAGAWTSPWNAQSGYYNCTKTFDARNALHFMAAYVNNATFTAGTPDTIDKVLALPAESTVEYLQLYRDMSYPGTEYWRGGRKEWVYTGTVPGSASTFLAHLSRTKIRRDVDKSLSGTPQFIAKLQWVDVKLLEGTVASSLTGSLYQDVDQDEKQWGNVLGQYYVVADPVRPWGATARDTYNAWEAEPNLLSTWTAEVTSANDTGTYTTTSRNVPLINTGSYTFKSRTFIDYDHRGRFYAAIRVEVACSGAQWDQSVAGYTGLLDVTTDPNYDVKIYFECQWAGVANELLLASGTCTRPAFEFIHMIAPVNVMIYPEDDTLKPLGYWIPPQPSIPIDSIVGLLAVAKHQGVNPHLTLQDAASGDLMAFTSATGIELSYLRDGREIPHKRFVRGQLYARSFKLADFSEALWLLSALKCDAHQYDNVAVGDAWFYLPALGSTIANDKMHVEVRNGVIGTWSDDIAPRSGGALPAAVDRAINLYSV